MNKKEVALEARLPVNPFLNGLDIPATSRLTFDEFQAADESGFRSPQRQLIDRSPHCKIFYDSEAIGIVDRLSECAKSLLWYMVFRLRYSKDYIKLDSKEYGAATGVKSRTTFAKAKNELYRLRFIEPTSVRSIYFINPAYFFAGSRTAKYPKNCTIKYAEKFTTQVPVPHPTITRPL